MYQEYDRVTTEKHAFIFGDDLYSDKTVPTGFTDCICIVWCIVQSRLSNYPYSERNALSFSLFMKSVEPVPTDCLWMLAIFSCKHSHLWGRLLQNLALSAINEKGKLECMRIFFHTVDSLKIGWFLKQPGTFRVWIEIRSLISLDHLCLMKSFSLLMSKGERWCLLWHFSMCLSCSWYSWQWAKTITTHALWIKERGGQILSCFS